MTPHASAGMPPACCAAMPSELRTCGDATQTIRGAKASATSRFIWGALAPQLPSRPTPPQVAREHCD